jgi:protein tyrosine phosphatase (PTP) superfamily phosphohydrolase (DUF442 family)
VPEAVVPGERREFAGVTPPPADAPPRYMPPADVPPGYPPAPERRESARIPAGTGEPPRAAVPPKRTPAVEEERDNTQPIDIVGYAILQGKGVATGDKPFSDGYKWLKDRGFRTVLRLRAPGVDDAAAKRLAEEQGLTYKSLEVSPENLTRDLVESFAKLVNDEANRPIFVYDEDGSLRGGLWYLYLRLDKKLSDDKARTEAVRLGLKLEDGGPHRTMWIAVQKLLGTSKL